jgi:hypothetical protein
VIAEGSSDQVVVTTLADLFDIQKALPKDNSAQLVGSMNAENWVENQAGQTVSQRNEKPVHG